VEIIVDFEREKEAKAAASGQAQPAGTAAAQ
jgi:hypothetical protein